MFYEIKRICKKGNAEIVEAADYDRIWGIGYSVKDASANRSNWGLNLLGKALMQARDILSSL